MGPIRVLLVEDEMDDALAAKRGLPENAGFVVTHVRSGADALDATEFDAALLDHRLTDMTGVEVCVGLRDAGFMGPVIMLSSVQEDDVIGKAFEAGVDDFVSKTSDYGDRLQDAVRLFLEL